MIVGDTVVALTDDGRLHRLAIAGGRAAEPVRLTSPDASAPLTVSLPLALLDDALVAAVEAESRWQKTTLIALSTTSGGSRGVSLEGRVWPVPERPWMAGTIAGEELFVPARDGAVYSVRSDGSSTRLMSGATGTIPFAVPAGGLLLTQVGSELLALDRATGATRWKQLVGEPVLATSPAVVGDLVVMPLRGTGLVGLDLATGTPRWIHRQTGSGTSSPLLLPGGDVAYAVGALVRLDARTGTIRWTISDIDVFGPLAFADGLIVGAGFIDDASALFAVDAETGKERWRQPFEPGALVSPAAGAGTVVAIDERGAIRALELATGRHRWSATLRGPAAGPPVVVGDLVAVAEHGRSEDLFQRDYRITLHDVATGRLAAAFEPPGTSFSSLGGFGGSADALLAPSTSFGPIVLSLRIAR